MSAINRGPLSQVRQDPGGDRVELAHVPERERPQERPQGGRGLGLVEHPSHATVAHDRHVVPEQRTGMDDGEPWVHRRWQASAWYRAKYPA